jgi:hypothetical protein
MNKRCKVSAEGGVVTVRGGNSEPRLSARDSIRFWANHNQCNLTPKREQLPDVYGSKINWISFSSFYFGFWILDFGLISPLVPAPQARGLGDLLPASFSNYLIYLGKVES